MSDQSIFGENQNSPQGTPANNQPAGGQSQNDQVMTLLASIKNESGEQKYKTLEEAVKALSHSQNFIPTLQSEVKERDRIIAELQTKVSKVDTLETTLQELIQRQSNTPTSVELDEDKVASLVSNTLTRLEQQKSSKTNLETVITEVRKVFGDKASEVFYAKAAEEGLSAEEINSLAARSPKAVFKLLGLNTAPTNNESIDLKSLNTTNFKHSDGSNIKANSESVLLGATTQQVVEETRRSRQLVDELHAQGLSTYDLSDPKVYNKIFGNK